MRMVTTSEQCPWCSSVITHEQFVKIERAIREEEKRRFATVEKEMRTRIEREVAAKVTAEQKKLAADRQALESDRAKLAEDRRSLAEANKRQMELVKQSAEKQRHKELTEQRAILEKDRDEALLKKDAAYARDRDGMKKKILELTRRIEQKSAGDLGDGAEIDLFEELRAEFRADKITRIQKGKPGGDIVVDVQYKGESCGTILIDSKNRQSWNASFVKKLRQDQTDAGANHAILATTVFPSGKKELCVDSSVIVVTPARAIVIVDLLRKAMISMHVAKLGAAERATKVTRLYAFITSTEFTQKMTEAESLTSDALQIDADEQQAHSNVWKRRGSLLMRIKHVLRDIDTDISAIVEARDVIPTAAMTVRAVEH